MSRGKDWTTKEINQLIDLYGRYSVKDIAEKMGRTVSSINNAARRVRLKNGGGAITRRRISHDDVKELIDFGYSSNQIAGALGSSGNNIRHLVRTHLPKVYQNAMRENGRRRQKTHNNLKWKNHPQSKKIGF